MRILMRNGKPLITSEGKVLATSGLIPSSTENLIKDISGIVSTDETTLNNAIAKGATDTPETATFAERTTADGGTIKDTIARIDKVKGNCVKLCQILRIGNFESTNGWYKNGSANISVANNVITTTLTADATLSNYTGYLSTTITAKTGHKYLVMLDTNADKSGKVYADFNTAIPTKAVDVVANTWTNLFSIGVLQGTSIPTSVYPREKTDGYLSGDSYRVRKVQVFDLTAMGLESITTADELAQYFGYSSALEMPYLGYQSETIVLTNSQNSVTSKTKYKTIDLGTLNWYKGIYSFYLANYSILDCASFTSMKVPGYTFAGLDMGGHSMDNKSYSPQSNIKTLYIKDSAYADAQAFKTAMSGVMLTYESTEYSTLDNLPTNARNLTDSEGSTIFPNGLCSVGDIHDEWDMAKGVAVKRVGVVNMGTLSWAKNTYNNILSFRVATANLPIAPTQGSAYLPNVLCCRYTTFKWNEAYSGVDMSLSQMSNAIVVQDSGYTDAATFKTAMSGVYLYYELAEPITYNVAPCKAYYKVSQNGKEIANSTELSAPFKADIAYRGMSAEDVSVATQAEVEPLITENDD